MNIISFEILGVHFAQKDELELLIAKSGVNGTAPLRIAVLHSEGGRSPSAADLGATTHDLAIWISNDFAACRPVAVAGCSIPVWKCSTVALIRHFKQLVAHLQLTRKDAWSPSLWLDDLVHLRALEILIQAYQLTHVGESDPLEKKIPEQTLTFLKARGNALELPEWWLTGLGFLTSDAERRQFALADKAERKLFAKEKVKASFDCETAVSGLILNTFFDFIETRDPSFFEYLTDIRTAIQAALPE